MRQLITICAAVTIILALAGTAQAAEYVETFDSSNADWLATTINNSGDVIYPAATHHSSGGNPNGCISGAVTSSSNRLYTLDCAWTTGPWGDMTGLTLTADYKIDGSVTGPSGAKVRFYVGTYTGGNDYYVSNDTFSWTPNDDTTWTTHQVELVAANFIEWPNLATHTRTFAQVIAAPEDMGLVFADGFTSSSTLGFSSTDGATIYVDNFGTVPEPATMSLLVLGGIGVLIRRRRK